MNKFDLNKAIEHFQLKPADVAKVLFPSAKYENLALQRVLKGKADLDTKQLYDLASFIGITVADLTTYDNWKGISENGYLVFIRGEYKAKLNYNGVYLTIYKGTQLIAEETGNIGIMTISDFIEHINNLIINSKTNSNGNN